MRINTLKITDFKNIAQANLQFAPKLNCLLGDNGMGKSNLLDAIHYLCMCKSMTGAADRLLVRRGSQFAMLDATMSRRDQNTTLGVALWPDAHRKSFKRDGKEYRRLSAHIGMFPVVLVSPGDLDLVTGTGEERRRFIDQSISQSDPVYLDRLVRYASLLQQRNRLLRDGCTDDNLFAAIDAPMAACALHITQTRRRHIAGLAAIHTAHARTIAPGETDDTGIEYIAAGGDNLEEELLRNSGRDRLLRHTTAGPHRDDISFTLNGMPLRRTASQGQQKTFTIALRLAQYAFVRQSVSIKPLLLLDDIFDKLDAHRVNAIVDIVRGPDFGQIFITDTDLRHMHGIIRRIDPQSAVWHVSSGRFTPMPPQQ